MKYVDLVEITCISGKGGNGVIAFSHFPNNYYGGPCGGNGGKGGNIYVKGNINTNSLLDINLKKIYKAEDGRDGASNNRQGRFGKDLILDLPIGSLIVDKTTNEVICDIINDQEKFLIVSGGVGGHGNAFFKTEKHNAPYLCENGEKGEAKELRIELKSLADVALIGFPNSGKSTLFKSITNTNVKIGDYKFTTLLPNISYKIINNRKIFFVDIPGIIEDAHLGKGLGFTFLRHAERVNYLILLLDGQLEVDEIIHQYQTIERELNLFSNRLRSIKKMITISKIDIISDQKKAKIRETFQKLINKKENELIFISGLKNINLEDLYQNIFINIKDLKFFHWDPEQKLVIDVNTYFDRINVQKINHTTWSLSSKKLNYWVDRIPYNLSTENRLRLEKKIINIINRANLVKNYKFKNNDLIIVDNFSFNYYEESIK
ncbi:Obg family GTPase CgtA [Mycoplasma sp. SG1]|uniref:Obg family GTPase CgtA n=1 Tax=Mycoplasma sp. SG1 TaxID=2810348 RepID=UPI0020251B9F|nr:GTPase ObgE [Mycoplasma sp. SG1]URM53110.1 GTPase ObgE [Mycoplasma sp. SG1]